ncbi:MAG: histidine--tRNA ligase [Phycisphaerales bacterium JB040]
MPDASSTSGKARTIKAPKGTRDAYPEDALRRRYVTQAWRDASIRCGFEEIEGPTFELAELYAVKSGEGILGELFQAFSGKAPEELERVKATGQAPYALRPEFTPTLARMYAARAKQLPQPCKWFTAGPYFRAERPQRGRLREFLQWNCDVIGLPGESQYAEAQSEAEAQRAEMDAEIIGVLVEFFRACGLKTTDVQIETSDRSQIERAIRDSSGDAVDLDAAFALLDRRNKLDRDSFEMQAKEIGFEVDGFDRIARSDSSASSASSSAPLRTSDLDPWVVPNMSIVRGLAYYTGTVFEVIADGERAVAGGGRYDNLIELFGGPSTPACGFGMGDVVLSLLLEDKRLMPEGAELLDAVSRPPASARPEAFVISADEDADALVRPLVASLRRGIERASFDGKPWSAERYETRPLHARHSYKSTRNLKKLLADAEKQFARFGVVVHGRDRVQLKHFDTRRDLTPVDVPGLPDGVAEFSTSPESPVYVGRAIALLR